MRPAFANFAVALESLCQSVRCPRRSAHPHDHGRPRHLRRADPLVSRRSQVALGNGRPLRSCFDALKSQAYLTRDCAFSRGQAQKIYVQTRMGENAAELWRWLDEGLSTLPFHL